MGLALVVNGFLSILEGDFDAARDFSERGLDVTQSGLALLYVRAALEFYSGRLEEGAVYLDRLLAPMRLQPSGASVEYGFVAKLLPEVALITGETSFLEVAETAAGTVLSSPSAGLLVIMLARAGLAMVPVQRGATLAAAEQLAALESQPFGTLSLTVRGRLLGLLSQTVGNLVQATARFEDALAFCRKAGYRPELAWSCCDYADTLNERGGPGDKEKAVALLDESLAITSELGMQLLMERVLSRREILKA